MLNRHRDRDWEAAYKRSRARLRTMLEGKFPEYMIQSEAKVLLNSHYRGKWKTIAALIRHELRSTWMRLRHYQAGADRSRKAIHGLSKVRPEQKTSPRIFTVESKL